MTWGTHLVVDCSGCCKAVSDPSALAGFAARLTEAIGMKAFRAPILEHFATHDPSKGGYSLVQLIETSSITGHFVDATGDAYLDVFSCLPFSADVAIGVINECLSPKSIRHTLLRRG